MSEEEEEYNVLRGCIVGDLLMPHKIDGQLAVIVRIDAEKLFIVWMPFHHGMTYKQEAMLDIASSYSDIATGYVMLDGTYYPYCPFRMRNLPISKPTLIKYDAEAIVEKEAEKKRRKCENE